MFAQTRGNPSTKMFSSVSRPIPLARMALKSLKVRLPSQMLPQPPFVYHISSWLLPVAYTCAIDTELAPDGHRHYSHLFMVYPLTTMNLSIADNYDLATKSIDWWCGRPSRSHYEVWQKRRPLLSSEESAS
jgi:hypothetical protein